MEIENGERVKAKGVCGPECGQCCACANIGKSSDMEFERSIRELFNRWLQLEQRRMGRGAGPQTISVSAVNQWGVWSNQPDTGGIKSYPHEGFNVGKPLSSINTLISNFNQEVPTSGAWDVAYDIWDSSNQYEIMLWTNYTGNPDGGGNVKPISYKYASSGRRYRSTQMSM
ncbi:hypothetical protein ACQ5SK_28840 [Bradyrhizobium japonicum]